MWNILILNCITNNCIWHTCITWQGTKLWAPWGWHSSVETCRSVIICQLIVHLLVIVQNKKNHLNYFYTLYCLRFWVWVRNLHMQEACWYVKIQRTEGTQELPSPQCKTVKLVGLPCKLEHCLWNGSCVVTYKFWNGMSQPTSFLGCQHKQKKVQSHVSSNMSFTCKTQWNLLMIYNIWANEV
jgi:hypothetical protein